jgi:hypothetical protein
MVRKAHKTSQEIEKFFFAQNSRNIFNTHLIVAGTRIAPER